MIGDPNCFGNLKPLSGKLGISRQRVVQILRNVHKSARSLFYLCLSQQSAGNKGLEFAFNDTKFLTLVLLNQSRLLSEGFVSRYYKELLDFVFGRDKVEELAGSIILPSDVRTLDLDKSMYSFIDPLQRCAITKYLIDLYDPVSTEPEKEETDEEPSGGCNDNSIEGSDDGYSNSPETNTPEYIGSEEESSSEDDDQSEEDGINGEIPPMQNSTSNSFAVSDSDQQTNNDSITGNEIPFTIILNEDDVI